MTPTAEALQEFIDADKGFPAEKIAEWGVEDIVNRLSSTSLQTQNNRSAKSLSESPSRLSGISGILKVAPFPIRNRKRVNYEKLLNAYYKIDDCVEIAIKYLCALLLGIMIVVCL